VRLIDLYSIQSTDHLNNGAIFFQGFFHIFDMFYEETIQPRARRAFRGLFKKHFAVVSILAPYHSLQIPYIQYTKMSNMYLLKEKQRCLVRSPMRGMRSIFVLQSLLAFDLALTSTSHFLIRKKQRYYACTDAVNHASGFRFS
jgi:hypothetical protein